MGGERRGRRGRRRAGGRPGREALPATLEGAKELAARVFRIERLTAEQEQAIEAVLAGRDTLAVLPTGAGKSLIYQVPALLLGGPTLVISPLIALMRDQERALARRGVPVVRLDSTLKVAERRAALERIRAGGRLIVLTTPETVESDDGREAIAAARPALLCVDEAHCISEWGHDFRPSYLRLGTERRALGVPTTLALTATATLRVQSDVADRLGMTDPMVVRSPPDRANLRLEVEGAPGGRKQERAGRLIQRLGRPGVIYCATTKAVDEIYGALIRARIPAVRYHGKMSDADRAAAERRYMKGGKKLVMVATTAFGMGIDKPDIRYVLHYQVPGSIEQYVQEAGRAGRDGLPSRCILLYDPADLEIQVFLQSKSRPSAAQLRRVGAALEAWVREAKPVDDAALALSAGTFQTTTRAMCSELEHLGLIARDEKKRWVSRVPPDDLARGIEDLAARFETLRVEDERRRRAIAAYAETDECRSVVIRRYFGEPDPPRCGQCDRCRARRAFEATTEAATRRALAAAEPEPERKKRRRRRRRGRGGEAASAPVAQAAAQTAAPPEARQRRKKRRRSRGGKGAETTAPAPAERQTAAAPDEPRRKKRRRRRGRGRGRGEAARDVAPHAADLPQAPPPPLEAGGDGVREREPEPEPERETRETPAAVEPAPEPAKKVRRPRRAPKREPEQPAPEPAKKARPARRHRRKPEEP